MRLVESLTKRSWCNRRVLSYPDVAKHDGRAGGALAIDQEHQCQPMISVSGNDRDLALIGNCRRH